MKPIRFSLLFQGTGEEERLRAQGDVSSYLKNQIEEHETEIKSETWWTSSWQLSLMRRIPTKSVGKREHYAGLK